MGPKTLLTMGIVLAALGLSACSANNSAIFRTANLDGGNSLVTDAKQRVLVSSYASGTSGINRPRRIVCAEPSPDVATALSSAISAAARADARRQGGNPASASGSAALGVTSAESVAQLGERLATIQLLRDGLYRVCEAYANGAVSETTYAIIISRIDDTMTALLASEMAAGAFGRKFAGISGTASVNTAQIAADETKLKNLENELKEDLAKLAALEASTPADDPGKEKKKTDIAAQNIRVSYVQRQIAAQQAAVAAAYTGGIVTVGGGISGSSSNNADVVAQIHKQFVNDSSLDSLLVACVSTLDRSPSARSGRNQNFHATAAESGRPDSSELTDICRNLFEQKGHASTFERLVQGKMMHAENMSNTAAKKSFYDLVAIYFSKCSEASNKDTQVCKSLQKQFEKSLRFPQ